MTGSYVPPTNDSRAWSKFLAWLPAFRLAEMSLDESCRCHIAMFPPETSDGFGSKPWKILVWFHRGPKPELFGVEPDISYVGPPFTAVEMREIDGLCWATPAGLPFARRFTSAGLPSNATHNEPRTR